MALVWLVATLAACGGGGGNADDRGGSAGADLQPASTGYARKCAPDNTLAWEGDGANRYTSGTLEDEKTWVRSYLNEAYLWYSEVPSIDRSLPEYNVTPAQVALDNWFDALKTPARTPAGNLKDRFSFTMPTAQWNALSQTGEIGGYGIEWILTSGTPPRAARVAYVEAGSPAAAAGVARGDTMLGLVSGGAIIDFANSTDPAEIALLNQAMFSPVAGTGYTFRLRSNSGAERNANLTAGRVTSTSVKEAKVLDSKGSKVGYLLFNDFFLPGEAQLKSAIEGFRAAAVSDLILDLRYNGGGYVYMASQLAYMIAPPETTAGKTFERSVFSDKRSAATSSASNDMGFRTATSGIPGSGTSANASLPNLGLNRVYVLTSAGTCSASESVINGLRGVDVEVILLGSGTCGKPYGFTARDNCGVSYFPVEFKGVNHKGFGDFADGFAPTCAVADDLENPLGNEREGLLAAALVYRESASCTPVTSSTVAKNDNGAPSQSRLTGTIVRPASRTGKYLAP